MVPVYLLKPLMSVTIKGLLRVHAYKVAGKLILTGGKLGVRYGSFLFEKVIGL